MSTRQIEGQLEIDYARGVIYFHPRDEVITGGGTLMRIQGLPRPIPKNQMLDIKLGPFCSWTAQ